jgi:hypothetical protein
LTVYHYSLECNAFFFAISICFNHLVFQFVIVFKWFLLNLPQTSKLILRKKYSTLNFFFLNDSKINSVHDLIDIAIKPHNFFINKLLLLEQWLKFILIHIYFWRQSTSLNVYVHIYIFLYVQIITLKFGITQNVVHYFSFFNQLSSHFLNEISSIFFNLLLFDILRLQIII